MNKLIETTGEPTEGRAPQQVQESKGQLTPQQVEQLKQDKSVRVVETNDGPKVLKHLKEG
jgi:hypothetical protein